MESFLKQVAQSLIEKYADKLGLLTVVFPNRRAGVFFSNYLNSLVSKPMISPDIVTVSELFTTISKYHIPDRLSLIIRLFKVYKDLTNSKESFDDYYHWGDMLISDFDQVDKYMINAEDLFTNITELKEIDSRFSMSQNPDKDLVKIFWTALSENGNTFIKQEFVQLWKDLAGIYENFRKVLHKEGLAYEGMLYRNAIDLLVNHKVTSLKDKKYAFIGFNALNRCEEVLFDFLAKEGRATFFWDFDNYYLTDNNQEAGLFIRKNLKVYPQEKFSHNPDLLKDKSKALKIINIASQTGQAQVAGEELSIFANNNGKFQFDDAAVVLCDEELLLPVISSLPRNIDKVNVTMGYPLSLTPVFSLISQLVDLQKNCRNNSKEPEFYYKDVLAILNNQLLISVDSEKNKEFSGLIMAENLIYVPASMLVINELYALIFSCPIKSSELSEYFQNLLKMLFHLWEKNENIENSLLYREFIFQACLAINNLREILFNGIPGIFGHDNIMSASTFRRIVLQYLGNITIPFEGEPLEGLQVMGILETRALDFNNIIMLSVNDGVMPKISLSGSFIPYNLRRAFGLPTIEEQNAMYAYYFYRLLQRADNVTFIYNSGSDGLVTGEKSRYLYQLQMESEFKISECTVTYKMSSTLSHPITISKDEKVMSLLNKYLNAEVVLSPTALDKYIICPLQFYFRYVTELKEPEEVSEDVDAQFFGLIFHNTMENIYKTYEGKILNSALIDSIINDTEKIEKIITIAFKEIYFKGVRDEDNIELMGKNRLIFEIVKKYVLQILTIDCKRAPFRIEGLEKAVNTVVPLIQMNQKILIGGVIDRIDRFDNYLQIIDYKTGRTELSYSMLSSLFDKMNKTRNKAAFQTLVYAYILYKTLPSERSIKPGIYDLRSIFKEDYDVFVKCKEDGNNIVDFVSIATQFEEYLINLLEEIFDANIPFEQTTIEENCTYCPYKQICRR